MVRTTTRHRKHETHDIARVESWLDREDWRGPLFWRYGVQLFDSRHRSLGLIELGWVTRMKDATKLMKAGVEMFTTLITAPLVVETTIEEEK